MCVWESEWPQVCLWSLADVNSTQLLCLCGLNFNWQSKTTNALSCLFQSPCVAPAAYLMPITLCTSVAKGKLLQILWHDVLGKILGERLFLLCGRDCVCVVGSSSLSFIQCVTWCTAWCLWLCFYEGREKDSVVLCSASFAKALDSIRDALSRSTLSASYFLFANCILQLHSSKFSVIQQSEYCMGLIPAKVKVTVGGHEEIIEPWYDRPALLIVSGEKLATWAILCFLMDHSGCVSVSEMAFCVHVCLSMYSCVQSRIHANSCSVIYNYA